MYITLHQGKPDLHQFFCYNGKSSTRSFSIPIPYRSCQLWLLDFKKQVFFSFSRPLVVHYVSANLHQESWLDREGKLVDIGIKPEWTRKFFCILVAIGKKWVYTGCVIFQTFLFIIPIIPLVPVILLVSVIVIVVVVIFSVVAVMVINIVCVVL